MYEIARLMDEPDLTVRTGYLSAYPDDGPPTPPPQLAAGTSTKVRAAPPPIPRAARRALGTEPPPAPEAAAADRASAMIRFQPSDIGLPGPDVDVDLDDDGPTPLPPPAPEEPSEPFVLAAPPLPAAAWLQTMPAPLPRDDEGVPTTYFERPVPDTRSFDLATHRRAYVYAAGAAMIGLLLGATLYFALRDRGGATPAAPPAAHAVAPAAPSAAPRAPAPPAPAAIEPAVKAPTPAPQPPVPAVAPAVQSPERPDYVQVPISSTPPGATVALITGGRPTIIGQTPVTASLDPKRAYDVVLAVAGHTSRLEHIAPGTRQLVVSFSAPPARPAPRRHH